MLLNNSVLAFDYAGAATYPGSISGSGGVTKAGPGMATLTSANNYSGGTTISAGTLQLGNGLANGSVTGNIVNNAALAFNNASPQTYGGKISGTGALVMLGANSLALTGSNTYSGGTFLANGTLNFTAGALPPAPTASPSAAASCNGPPAIRVDVSAAIAPIAAGQTAAIDTNGNNVTFAAGLSGSGGLTKYGAGSSP